MRSILDKEFRYAPAKSHEGSAEEFAKRQEERKKARDAAAASKVQPISTERDWQRERNRFFTELTDSLPIKGKK